MSTAYPAPAFRDLTLPNIPSLNANIADTISKLAPVVATIAALRAATSATLAQTQCFVAGYAATNDGGQGTFIVTPGDTTTADDGGLTIVDASNRRWMRIIQGAQIDVRAFGVLGANPTADTAALNAAIATTAGKATLVHPARLTVTVTAPLILGSGAHVVLNGTWFKQAVTDATLQFDMVRITADNVTLEGRGTIDGNVGNQVTGAAPSAAIGTWYRPWVAGTTWPYHGTSTTDYSGCYKNVHISGITIQNTINWAISVSLQYSLVTGVTFFNSHNSPQLINSLSTHFVDCTANSTQDDGLGIYGGCSYCSVNSCKVFNSGTGAFILSDNSGIPSPPNAQPNVGCSIINTVAQNCSAAGIFVDGGSSVSSATVATDTLVAGNVTFNCASPLTVRNVTNFKASDNILQQATDAEGTGCIYLSGTLSYVTIEGNTVWAQANNACIQVANDNVANVAVLIARNKLCNPGSSGSSFGVELVCVGSSAYVTVSDNEAVGIISVIFSDTSATPASVFRGTNAVGNANNQYQTSQGLVLRALGAANTTGIDMEPNGNATFHGTVTAAVLSVLGAATIDGELTVVGNINAEAGEITTGTTATGALSAAGAVALGTGAGGATPGVGFFGTSPVGKLTISGSRGGNTAVASMLTQFASMGILTDATTA